MGFERDRNTHVLKSPYFSENQNKSTVIAAGEKRILSTSFTVLNVFREITYLFIFSHLI